MVVKKMIVKTEAEEKKIAQKGIFELAYVLFQNGFETL